MPNFVIEVTVRVRHAETDETVKMNSAGNLSLASRALPLITTVKMAEYVHLSNAHKDLNKVHKVVSSLAEIMGNESVGAG